MDKWKGCIVEESLEDNRVMNGIEVVKVRITEEENPKDRWHIYNSLLSEEEINKVHPFLKQSWYMHFWKDKKMLVLFRGNKFILDIEKKETWTPAIEYGLSINIPKEQLDFETEF